jgi:hypothetical protein
MGVEAKWEKLRPRLPRPIKPRQGRDYLRVGTDTWRSGLRQWVRPLNPDGSPARPFGKVEAEVSSEEGYEAARLAVHYGAQ